MALTSEEFRKLKKACNALPDGPDYRGGDYATILLETALNFFMHNSTVVKAMEHYSEHHGYRTHKQLGEFIDSFPNSDSGNERLANAMWNNNHWSRAKFLRMLIDELEARGVKGEKTLKKWAHSVRTEKDFEREIKGQFRTEEHSMAIAIFSWLQLRLGVPTVKPDVHVVNFVSDAIGRRVHQNELNEVKKSLCRVAQQTDREPALLDSAIWHHQRGDDDWL